MSHGTVCNYCGNYADIVAGDVIYPHRPDLAKKWFYRCDPCDAYVGCHPKTTIPLGSLANAELRKARSAAHDAFDPMWKRKWEPHEDKITRPDAYAWLAEKLGIAIEDTHIGQFDIPTCQKVVEIMKPKPKESNNADS